LDDRRVEELQAFYNQIRDHIVQDPVVVGDFAMLLSNPLISHVLYVEIMKEVNSVIEQQMFPKDSERLKFFTSVLVVSHSSWRIVSGGKSKLPKPGSGIFKVFFPLMADLSLQNLLGMPEDISEKFSGPLSHDKAGVCSSILAFYTLSRIRALDVSQISFLLSALIKSNVIHDMFDPIPISWFHCFLSSLHNVLTHMDMAHSPRLERFITSVLFLLERFSKRSVTGKLTILIS
jgi:hypothetical protein